MLDTAKLIRECVDDIAKEFPALCEILKTNYPTEGFNCEAEIAYLKEQK